MATVYILVWTGSEEVAKRLVEDQFPGSTIQILNRREMRESGWRGQVKALRKLQGNALIYFFQSLSDVREPLLLAWSGALHHCNATVFLDSSGRSETYKRADRFQMIPRTLGALIHDVGALAWTWVAMGLLSWRTKPQSIVDRARELDLVYLQADPFRTFEEGGARTHAYGFLEGLASHTSAVLVMSATGLEVIPFPVQQIPLSMGHFFFKQALLLRLSWEFARKVVRTLGSRKTRCIYQRHSAFRIDGALLSRWLETPLILEYNGSELWIARHWDPTRFLAWLRKCEDLSLRSASRIVVVSEPLRQELISRGIPDEAILVNPNGVNPFKFKPHCGGDRVRRELRIQSDEVVVGFLGSFSYWHGIPVLQRAISTLLAADTTDANRIRFLLIGDGPLRAEMQADLRNHVASGRVIFAGLIPHESVPSYLDASDILCSPHVSLPDGSMFFGSPTKLFEYMSAGKSIVASDLAQLSEVLRKEQTAVLIAPGEDFQLVNAVLRLAGDIELREFLGRNAREEAVTKYTWSQNAERILRSIRPNFALAGQMNKVPRAVSAEQLSEAENEL